MPRYDPRIHQLCTTLGCHHMEMRHFIRVYGIEKDVCLVCYQLWECAIAKGESLSFLLTLEDKAALAAMEMVKEANDDAAIELVPGGSLYMQGLDYYEE